jgi:hypothetical protein
VFRAFAERLSQTPLSDLLQKVSWVVPTSQTLHIIALSVVVSSALVINARLLGIGHSTRSVPEVVATHVPWIWRALALALFTGIVQTIAEPVRQFVTPVFWAKLLMIAIVVTATAVLASRVRSNPGRWEGSASVTSRTRLTGLAFGPYAGTASLDLGRRVLGARVRVNPVRCARALLFDRSGLHLEVRLHGTGSH